MKKFAFILLTATLFTACFSQEPEEATPETTEETTTTEEATEQPALTAESIRAEQEKADEISNAGDVDQCQTLKEPRIRQQCTNNSYLKLARQENDPKHCEPLEDEVLKQMCLSQIDSGEEL